MQVTAFPRTKEMTDKQWCRFRSYNFKRRKSGKCEIDFTVWRNGNKENWPGAHKQQSGKPERWPDAMWNNFIACRSYRKCKGLKPTTVARYEYKQPLETQAEKLARVVAKINAKAGWSNK